MDRAALVLIFGVALVFYASIQLHHDVAWFAYWNLRQLEGIRPYVDIMEINPPIAFYLTLAPVALVMTQAIVGGPYRNQLALDAAPYIECYAPHGSVFVMSSKMSAAFPMVLDSGAKWASRFPIKRGLSAIIRSQRPDSGFGPAHRASLARLAAAEIDATVEDFRRHGPDIVLVDCGVEAETGICDQPVDVIEYYRRDPRFRETWAQYALKDVLSSSLFRTPTKLEIWVRDDQGATPAPAPASHPAASLRTGSNPAREAAGPPQDSRAHPSPEQETPHEEK